RTRATPSASRSVALRISYASGTLLMKDFFAGRLVEVLDVRNLQGADRLDGRRQRGIGRAAAPASRQIAPRFSQRSQDLGTIESLAGAVLTEPHRLQPQSPILRGLGAASSPPPPVSHFFFPRVLYVTDGNGVHQPSGRGSSGG